MSDIFTSAYPGSSSFALASYAGIGIGIGLLGLILVIVIIIGTMKVYSKAGKPGWAAFIPIYSQVVLLQIVRAPMWWLVLIFLSVIASIVTRVGIVIGLANLVSVVTMIVVFHKLSKAFGHGVGYTIGLILLPFIFLPMLGFGKSEYLSSVPSPVPAPMA